MEELLSAQWDNATCLGYVISTLENLDYSYEEIWRIVAEMKELFDWVSLDDARVHYCESSY